MNWYIETVPHRCGTEHNMIVRDLKTLRGVLNRVALRRNESTGAFIHFKVFTFGENFYDETKHKLVHEE